MTASTRSETGSPGGYFNAKSLQFLDRVGERPFYSKVILNREAVDSAVWVPFSYRAGSCVIRFWGGKLEMLQYNGNVVDNTFDGMGRKRKTFLLEKPYCAYVGHLGGAFRVVRFKCLALAISFAHTHRHMSRKFRGFQNIDIVETRCYRIIKPVVDIIPDHLYNKLVGATAEPPRGMKEVVKYSEYPDLPTDEVIYRRFETLLLDVLHRGQTTLSTWHKSSNCVGTLETLPGEEALLGQKKREVDPQYVEYCVRRNGFPPLVTRIPKTGHVTSSGHTRAVYAMNILYEWRLRKAFGSAKVECEYDLVRGRNFGDRPGFYYDIIGADYKSVPYLARFGREHGMEWLLPYVHDPISTDDNSVSYINQMPSGIYHTTIVNNCLTAALLHSLGVKEAKIQGDGVVVYEVLNHPWLRQTDDINGFYYAGGEWLYNRMHRLYEAKYCRGAGPSGLMRYLITWWSYSQLGPIEPLLIRCDRVPKGDYGVDECKCGTIIYKGRHFWHLTDHEIAEFINKTYSDVGRLTRMVLEEKGLYHDLRGNSWDTHKSEKEEWIHRVEPGEQTLFPRVKFE